MEPFCTPTYDAIWYLPKDFFNKKVNEPFIQKIMSSVLDQTEWTPGDPVKLEPDYFCKGVPFEFTIASNSKKKNNFIQKFMNGSYSSDDVEEETFSYIAERIADKAQKTYSVSNVHLCVLCILAMYDWVSDIYGSYTHNAVDFRLFFRKIKEEYIMTKKFSNIFIIFPDCCATWWTYDVLTDCRKAYELTDTDISGGLIPYVMIKNAQNES